MKWVLIGVSRTLAAFSLLSLMFTETWTRGWLSWVLKHWSDVVHRVCLHIPFAWTPKWERILVLGVIFGIILDSDIIIDRNSKWAKAVRDDALFPLLIVTAGLVSIMLLPMFFAGALQAVSQGQFPGFAPTFIMVFALAVLGIYGRSTALITVGIALALLAINYGANLFGVAPPPA